MIPIPTERRTAAAKRWALTILLCYLIPSPPPISAQTSMSTSGIVVDEQGNPITGAEVSQFWLGGSGELGGFRSFGSVKTDESGRFRLQVDGAKLPATAFVMDSGRRLGSLLIITDADSGSNVRVKVVPLHQVHYRFEGVGLKDLSQTRILLSPSSGSMFSQISGPIKGVIALPPGKFTFTIASPDEGEKKIQFEVSDQDIVLDPITISAGIAQYYGRQAPSLSATLPVNVTSFSPVQLRGKWVLIYFWAYWCAPCVEEGLPKLATFYEQRRDSRDRFEILGVHENGVPEMITVEGLRQKMKNLQTDKWHNRSLPFTILLDRGGGTAKTWGISGYPTVALIDPEGRLVRGDLETLRQALSRK